VKNVIGILMGIILNLSIGFGRTVILTILIQPIHEHGRSFSLLKFLSSVFYSFYCSGLFHL
jgi:hypothetical protein